ncbi:MAG: L-histidine N(alpha)-methyltransferase [Leptolyngbyaceae cyanobacterium]
MPVHSHSTPSVPETSKGADQPPTDMVELGDRFTLEDRTLDALPTPASSGQDVIAGLTQAPKTLPPKYFYDAYGSQLFEKITDLPEYYLTRTERQILATYAEAIAAAIGACDLIELGSGSASKTRLLFDAYQRQGTPLRYVPVDVSGSILESSARDLLVEYPTLTIHGLIGTYEAALNHLPSPLFPRRMIAFIGSTLGNLPPQLARHFFQQVSQALTQGDYFLLGVDRHKDTPTLEAAYNDRQGVTADFNLNMLTHLNWRFEGNFDLDQFRHVARYNEAERQIEMYIESLADQTVTLQALNLTITFAQGEQLLSEISRKFEPNQLAQELSTFGLETVNTFTDQQQKFALLLCQKS